MKKNIEDEMNADDYWRIPLWNWDPKNDEHYRCVGVELKGRGLPFITREQAIAVVNKARKAGVMNGCKMTERVQFIPSVVIAFPYQIGWEQGTYVFASIDRECHETKHPHAFEITAKGFPGRKQWYPRPEEFPAYTNNDPWT